MKDQLSPATTSAPAQTEGPTPAPTSDQDQLGNSEVTARLGLQDEEEDHDHEPEPGTDATPEQIAGRTVGDDVDATNRTEIFALLNASARTQTLLAEIAAVRGDTDFKIRWSDRGNYHSAGEIRLDRHNNIERWFPSLSHELVHLLTFISGNAASVATDDRQTFVDRKVGDEINAQAVSFVTLLQQGRETGGKGHEEFLAWLRSDHPEVLDGPLEQRAPSTGWLGDIGDFVDDALGDWTDWARIEELAKEWLEDKYRNDPDWTTSTTGEDYYTYWGGVWDEAHP